MGPFIARSRAHPQLAHASTVVSWADPRGAPLTHVTLTTPDDSLAGLLARAARGDQDSFARLYDETSPRIYGLVLRVVRSPALAEQVTREVFLQAWLDAHDYRPPTCPVSWLMSSAHRQAVDSVRATESAEVGLDVHPVEVDAEVAVVTAAQEAAGAGRESDVLAGLPSAEREAVELAYFGGYTHAEVAVLLGLRAGSARRLIRDGLLRLRGGLAEPA